MRKAFLSGEFERLLRSLNRDLRVYCGDDDKRPAGLVLLTPDGFRELGSVDKGMIPENTIFHPTTGIPIKKGWRAVIKSLLSQRLISGADVERKLPRFYKPTEAGKWERPVDPREEAVAYFKKVRPQGKYGGPVYRRKDLLEMGDIGRHP